MSPLTLFLGQVFGLTLVLMCLAFVVRPKALLAAIQSMTDSPGLILITGVVTMIAGLAVVLGHNVWSGGAVAIAVTVLGWVTLIKGFALMATPPGLLAALYRVVGYPQRFRLVMGVALVIGLWLTWAAFTTPPALAT
ncbi:MAG TPA: hypothetical protein VGF33_06930 [Caulobacteraceae bacterium]|jgi:hypothetical protein